MWRLLALSVNLAVKAVAPPRNPEAMYRAAVRTGTATELGNGIDAGRHVRLLRVGYATKGVLEALARPWV
jgi:hypothetical protein